MKGKPPPKRLPNLFTSGSVDSQVVFVYIGYRGLNRASVRPSTNAKREGHGGTGAMSTDPRAQIGAYVAYGVDLYLVTDCDDRSIELENCKGVDSSTGHAYMRIRRHRAQVSLMQLVQAAPSVEIPQHLERQMAAAPVSA